MYVCMYTHTHTHTQTHTHTHTLSLSLSLSHTHTHANIHIDTLVVSHTHTLSLSLSLTHTHANIHIDTPVASQGIITIMYGPAMHALHCGKDREKTRANKRESARARETERGRERECVCESGRERGRENERASEGGRERARLGQQPQTLYPNLIDAVNDELHWRGVFSQLPRPVQPSFQTHAQSALRRPKKKQDKSHQSRSMPTHLERRVWLKCTKACVLVCVWLGLSVCSPENLFLSVLYNTVPEHICPLLSALPSPSESRPRPLRGGG